MFKSLVFKEWLKLKWIFVGLVVLNCLVILNIYLNTANTLKVYSANAVLAKILAYEILIYADIMYVPLLSGLLLAVFQFFPEISQKRLKLTFHLPVRENILLVQMTLVGISLYLIIFITDIILLSIINLTFFPKELFYAMLVTTLPWYIGGLCAYFWIVMIFIEPNWTKKIVNFIVGYFVVSLYYAGVYGGSGFSRFEQSLIYFLILSILCGTIIFISSYNFKRGIS